MHNLGSHDGFPMVMGYFIKHNVMFYCISTSPKFYYYYILCLNDYPFHCFLEVTHYFPRIISLRLIPRSEWLGQRGDISTGKLLQGLVKWLRGKSLQHEHEDLSLGPQHPGKSHTWSSAWLCEPVATELGLACPSRIHDDGTAGVCWLPA